MPYPKPILTLSKRALTFALTLVFVSSHAFGQVTPQSVSIPFKCSTCTATVNLQALVYLPANYSSSTARYPVLFYNNGTMLPADLSGMATQPLPYMISHGMSLDNIVNPQDGKKYSFIVVAVVNNQYPAIPTELRWLNARYRVDNSRVYVTGLSQGGLNTVMTVASADSVSKYLSAAVAMSSPGVPLSLFNFSLLNTYKIKTWYFGGNTDAFTATGTDVYYAQAQSVYPGGALKTIYNGGHGGWNTFYDVNYKDPQNGLNIYQWMLTSSSVSRFPILPVKIKSIKLNRKS